MINHISTITTPYSAVTNKENYTSGDPADVNKLDATQWNNLSSAVATAHTKINQMLGNESGDVTVNAPDDLKIESGSTISLNTEGSISIVAAPTSGEPDEDVNQILVSTGSIEVDTTRFYVYSSDGTINLSTNGVTNTNTTAGNVNLSSSGSTYIISEGEVVLQCDSQEDIYLTVGSNTVAVSDIITVVNYFKNNTSSGPFASLQ